MRSGTSGTNRRALPQASKPYLRRSSDLRNNSLLGRDIRANALGGREINETTLGPVPNALALGGLTADQLKVRCPAGTVKSADTCIETNPDLPRATDRPTTRAP